MEVTSNVGASHCIGDITQSLIGKKIWFVSVDSMV